MSVTISWGHLRVCFYSLKCFQMLYGILYAIMDRLRGVTWMSIPNQFNFGPVRWSGIPDQLISVRSGGPDFRTNLTLVRYGGPEFRTNFSWSGPVVRNPGPDHVGPIKWSGFWSGFPDRTNFGPGWSGFSLKFSKLTKNEKNEFSLNSWTFKTFIF